MNLKRLVEISSLILAFLIFNGYLKLYLYYGHWNIKIIDYLDFSEIILSFFNDLNIIIFCFIVFICHQLLGLKLVLSLDNKLKGKLIVPTNQVQQSDGTIQVSLPSSEPISDAVVFAFDNYTGWFLLICAIFTSIFSFLFFWFNSIVLLYVSIASFAQFIFLSCLKFLKLKENILFPLLMITTFLVFTFCVSRYDIKNTELEAGKKITTIYTENEIITSSESNLFLGKTQKFLYFYDVRKKQTRIIPTDKIKNIETIVN